MKTPPVPRWPVAQGSRRFGIPFLSLLVLGALPLRAQLIDTASAWLADGTPTGAGPFGEGGFPAWGQTFTPPTGYNTITSFSVWLQVSTNSSDGFDDVDFVGKLYEWDAGQQTLTGPALYVSPPQHLAYSDAPNPPFQEFTAQIGKLPLDPAKAYLFYLSAYELFNGVAGAAVVGTVFPDTYPGGDAYISETSPDNLATTPWYPMSDMAFIARFSAVPESSWFGLFGAALLTCLPSLRLRLRNRRSLRKPPGTSRPPAAGPCACARRVFKPVIASQKAITGRTGADRAASGSPCCPDDSGQKADPP